MTGLSPTGTKIRELFAEILGCTTMDISEHSDFFEMGGDSLRAGRLLSAIRRELNVRVPIQALFNNGSVSALCDYISQLLEKTQHVDHEEEKEQDTDTSLSGQNCSSTNPLVMLV